MQRLITILLFILLTIHLPATILLTDTDQTLEITTSAAVSTDYLVDYADHSTSAFTPGSSQGNIATATTTTVASAPGASGQRQIKSIFIRNRHASSAQTVIVKKDVASTEYHLSGVIALLHGESVLYMDGAGWMKLDASGTPVVVTGAASGTVWGDVTGTLSDQSDLQAALDLKAPLASPSFSGTVTLQTPFNLGATSVTPTGAELNYVDGVTSGIQGQLDAKAASGANTDITSVLLNQTGLVIKGVDANALTIKPNETLTAGRTLNIITGDASRTLTLGGNATLNGGTHSGTNTGDQTSIVGITGTLSEFNTALTGADFATGGGMVTGASSGTNTGDQTLTGLGGAPVGSPFITTTSDATLSNEFSLSGLANGLLKNTTTTGVPTIAVEGTDYYGPAGTDVLVSDGGTGASDASGARTNLGLVIGTHVQAYDSDLSTIAGLTATTDNFIVANASAWASRTPAQAKTSLALVKGDVGLGNVDNTSDANKPVSTAQQTALDLKANLASPTFTGTVTITSPFTVGATSVTATGTELNYVAGVTSAIQTQLNGKQSSDSELSALAGLTSAADKLPYFTGSGMAGVTDLSSFVRTFLDDADAATVRATIGAGTGSGTVTSVSGTTPISSSGGATPAISLDNNGVTFAKMQTVVTDSLLGRDTAGTGNVENITLNATLSMDGSGNLQRAALTGDVTSSAGSNATTLANGTVTAAKTNITGTVDGTKFLRDDWTWQSVSSSGMTHAQTMMRASLGF
jgi:hypothetical protein